MGLLSVPKLLFELLFCSNGRARSVECLGRISSEEVDRDFTGPDVVASRVVDGERPEIVSGTDRERRTTESEASFDDRLKDIACGLDL